MPAPRLDELVARIYDAALDATLWPAFLHEVSGALKAPGSSIFLHNVETRDASLDTTCERFAAMEGVDPHFVRLFTEHYNKVNVWTGNADRFADGRVVTSEMLYPPHELLKTEWYADWLRPLDMFHGIGCMVVRSGPVAVNFTTVRSRRVGEFRPAEVRLFKSLVPHLQRAVTIHRRFQFLRGLEASMVGLLDMLAYGVVLLDDHARVLFANRQAKAYADARDGLAFAADGSLIATGSNGEAGALARLLGAARRLAHGESIERVDMVRLTRRNGQQLFAVLAPYVRDRLTASGRGIDGLIAALVVFDPQRPPEASRDRLRQAYALTPAETELCVALLKGLTLKDYAERQALSRETAATHLQNAMAKVGVHRQADLMRTLMLGPAVFGD